MTIFKSPGRSGVWFLLEKIHDFFCDFFGGNFHYTVCSLLKIQCGWSKISRLERCFEEKFRWQICHWLKTKTQLWRVHKAEQPKKTHQKRRSCACLILRDWLKAWILFLSDRLRTVILAIIFNGKWITKVQVYVLGLSTLPGCESRHHQEPVTFLLGDPGTQTAQTFETLQDCILLRGWVRILRYVRPWKSRDFLPHFRWFAAWSPPRYGDGAAKWVKLLAALGEWWGAPCPKKDAFHVLICWVTFFRFRATKNREWFHMMTWLLVLFPCKAYPREKAKNLRGRQLGGTWHIGHTQVTMVPTSNYWLVSWPGLVLGWSAWEGFAAQKARLSLSSMTCESYVFRIARKVQLVLESTLLQRKHPDCCEFCFRIHPWWICLCQIVGIATFFLKAKIHYRKVETFSEMPRNFSMDTPKGDTSSKPSLLGIHSSNFGDVYIYIYRCFLKWWYPQNTSTWSFLVGKPMGLLGKPTILGNHHINVHFWEVLKLHRFFLDGALV